MGLELDRLETARPAVRAPSPMRVDPRCHREDVVRRLLRHGITVDTLVILLPDWGGLIRTTALALPPEESATEVVP